ncbi:MAG: M20/M25/M40 family metallo-hydrolase, partial [Candidatus Dormibacteraceae bacterium]
RADVRRNCDWLADRLRALGFTVQITDVEGGTHPVLQADWRGAGEDAPTLTIYGHYDVQPPDPLEEWESHPFEPVIRDGMVYARGCADNKGNHMAALRAAGYVIVSGSPINLRFLMEGEEEIAGSALPRYLQERADQLHSDYTLVWDSLFEGENRPSLTSGLRGRLYVELEATGAAIDLHSGFFGGVAPNPCNTLARVLADLKGRDGVITIPSFYDDVRPPSSEEASKWDRSEAYAESIRRRMQASALEGEVDFAPVERMWSRPTLDVHGLIGGFTGEGQKTVIPAWARAKLSMRLVPDQDPDRIAKALAIYVQDLTTPGVHVGVKVMGQSKPVLLDWQSRAATALADAFQASFGVRAFSNRCGGSIPVMLDFLDQVGGQVVCSGLIQADCGMHAPNEHLSLEHYHRGIETLVHFLYGLA